MSWKNYSFLIGSFQIIAATADLGIWELGLWQGLVSKVGSGDAASALWLVFNQQFFTLFLFKGPAGAFVDASPVPHCSWSEVIYYYVGLVGLALVFLEMISGSFFFQKKLFRN